MALRGNSKTNRMSDLEIVIEDSDWTSLKEHTDNIYYVIYENNEVLSEGLLSQLKLARFVSAD